MIACARLVVSLWFVLCLSSALVFAFSPQFLPCQLTKPLDQSPLLGCPSGTIFVSPTDTRAKFKTVQDAVLSLPKTGQATILIGKGVYHETVNVTRSSPLTLLGQLNDTSILPSSSPFSRNLVTIWDNRYVVNGLSNAQTAVLVVQPSTNFKAYNIDLQNRAANYAISQALVTSITKSNASFYGCTLASYQDTWYTGNNANTFVEDTVIYGQVDYLYGTGTAWFENVTLANRACGGGIAAWRGTDQVDAPGNRFGAYISNSRIIRSPDANATLDITGKCSLGRPWNDLATTVYMRTSMDATIQPVGFTPWGGDRPTILNTTFYAEYKNSGPGANTSRRVDHILTDAEAENFTLEKIFGGRPSWIDVEYQN